MQLHRENGFAQQRVVLLLEFVFYHGEMLTGDDDGRDGLAMLLFQAAYNLQAGHVILQAVIAKDDVGW